MRVPYRRWQIGHMEPRVVISRYLRMYTKKPDQGAGDFCCLMPGNNLLGLRAWRSLPCGRAEARPDPPSADRSHGIRSSDH